MAASSTPHEHAEHGPGRYMVILLILVAMTGLTVVTGRMDLGALNLPLAMIIAGTKATLVVLFFMHMLEAEIMNKIVFVVSVVFLFLLILGSYGDLATRWKPTLPLPDERSAPLVVPDWHEPHDVAHGGGHGTAPGHQAPPRPAP